MRVIGDGLLSLAVFGVLRGNAYRWANQSGTASHIGSAAFEVSIFPAVLGGMGLVDAVRRDTFIRVETRNHLGQVIVDHPVGEAVVESEEPEKQPPRI